jgi:hypothetical protein
MTITIYADEIYMYTLNTSTHLVIWLKITKNTNIENKNITPR